MVGDIAGLYKGLVFITGFLLSAYNASKFEKELVKSIFKFQKTLLKTTQTVKKVSSADLVQIMQNLEKQQVLELPSLVIMLSKFLCRSLFSDKRRSQLRRLEKAK